MSSAFTHRDARDMGLLVAMSNGVSTFPAEEERREVPGKKAEGRIEVYIYFLRLESSSSKF